MFGTSRPQANRATASFWITRGVFKSDGKRLWIPVAESRRNGLSIIRVFAMADMIPDRPLQSEFEFPVNDHIDALAVDVRRGRVLGASWDTETVYVWNLEGQLQRILTGATLSARGLCVSTDGAGKEGVAVQDWKFIGRRLMASGLFRSPTSAAVDPRSWLVAFDHFLDSEFQKLMVTLPSPEGIELANEGMDVLEGAAYFLPEDLGASNRLFQVQLTDLFP